MRWEASGYEPVPILASRRHTLHRLLRSTSDNQFWTTFRELTRVKQRPTAVTATRLHGVFRARMNPPAVLPPRFDALAHAVDTVAARAIPAKTSDRTDGQFFSRPFTLDEIDAVKAHIRSHGKGSARGADNVSYDDVLNIPSEDLLQLFTECIDAGQAPAAWVTAIIAAVKKPGKDGSNPESYRTIGLESCLLKTLTLLIDRRLREWAETEGHIPDSQSGFRTGHRTGTNAFVLRTAIEKARTLGKPLYVVFVDLANAFPSVNQPTLWRKLADKGASGPLIDWLRMLYENLEYTVRFNGETTETFRALAGILIGDPASPILWDLFLADFALEPHADDLVLGDGERVAKLELADDIAFLSLSCPGMQHKLDEFETYCGRSFLTVNVLKTLAMIHGVLPNPLPTLRLYGESLTWVQEATYVGMTFSSTARDIFAGLYVKKALAARRISNATYSLESYIGAVPTLMACDLYRACIDPHLTFGCEVALDVSAANVARLQSIQHAYLRRALPLGPFCQLPPLFTETGIWPIRHRRVYLALAYLRYILREHPALPYAALCTAWELASRTARGAGVAHTSWWGDLHHTLANLPVPVHLPLATFPTEESVSALMDAVSQSLANSLRADTLASARLPLLRTRTLRCEDATLADMCAKRAYLGLPRRRQREALIRLVCSEHGLAIEALRRTRPDPVPRERRICRFCRRRSAIEDERHVLLECDSAALTDSRARFLEQARAELPAVERMADRMTAAAFLDMLLGREKLLPLLADYVADIFDLCEAEPCLLVDDDTLAALDP